LKTQSYSEDATIYWTAAENGESLRDDIERLIQVRQVVDEKQRKNLSPEERDAVQQKGKDLSRLEDDIKSEFMDAFRNGVILYNGDETEPGDSSKRLETILEGVTANAIPRVYTKYEPELAEITDDDIDVRSETSEVEPSQAYSRTSVSSSMERSTLKRVSARKSVTSSTTEFVVVKKRPGKRYGTSSKAHRTDGTEMRSDWE